ncbi:MAG: hypothetical protein FWD48_02385 [Oscillospiraceae bacterium]|nr:hypothetical protein [Oscillospiraceae bacterium]
MAKKQEYDGYIVIKDMQYIFDISYVTAKSWLGERNKEGVYEHSDFKDSFKCSTYNKIFIPKSAVVAKINKEKTRWGDDDMLCNEEDNIEDLHDEYQRIKYVSKNKYNERVYVNLPVTRLERAFFKIFSERMKPKTNMTRLLKRMIKALMRKYPKIVTEAKYLVDDNLDITGKGNI